jgi:transcriptional regulator with XRE-family HTH domain
MKNVIGVVVMASKGLRQFEVAQQIGYCDSVVSRILNGRQLPTKEQAEKIAKVLDIPVSELFPATR